MEISQQALLVPCGRGRREGGLAGRCRAVRQTPRSPTNPTGSAELRWPFRDTLDDLRWPSLYIPTSLHRPMDVSWPRSGVTLSRTALGSETAPQGLTMKASAACTPCTRARGLQSPSCSGPNPKATLKGDWGYNQLPYTAALSA